MRNPTAVPQPELVVQPEQQERHDGDDGDRRVLTAEVGGGALLHGLRDLLHALGAFRAAHQPDREIDAEADCNAAADQGEQNGVVSEERHVPALLGITKSALRPHGGDRDPAWEPDARRVAVLSQTPVEDGPAGPRPVTAPFPGGTPRRHNPRMVYRPRALWGRLPRRAKLIVPLAVALVAAAIAVPVVMASGGTSGPCAGGQADDYTCWQDYFTGIVDKQGGEAALGEINAYRAVNSYVLANCHTLVHAIGRAALLHYGSINEASKHGDYTCWSGYFHGIYEKYMAKFDGRGALQRHPDDLQAPAERPLRVRLLQLPARHRPRRHDPLRQRPVQGPPVLRRLRGGLGAHELLHRRLHAEHRRRPQMHQSVRLKPDDPVYPCDAVDDQVQVGLLPRRRRPTSSASRLRLQEGLRGLRRHRGRVLANLLRQHGARHQRQLHIARPRRFSSSAASATPSCQEWCFIGAARNAVFNDHGHDERRRPLRDRAGALSAELQSAPRVRPRACDDAEARHGRP